MAATVEIARSCCAAGSCVSWATPTMTMMKLATSSSVAVSLGSRGPKRITPSDACRAPSTMTRPSTSSALTNSEPMIDVWATTTSPARSAKMTTKSSGRLPRVDCSTPVAAGPEALAHLLGGQRDEVGQAGERHRGDREGQQRGPAGVMRDAGQHGRREDPGDDLQFAAAQPSHGGSEDTHDPHYAARRCCASPWPACAPAAASR